MILIYGKALKYLVEEVNEQVRLHIIKHFEQTLFLANEFKTKKISELNFKIENELITYDTEIRSKLAYLKEQANIARELNIKVGATDQFINLQYNVDTEPVFPLYTRGYKALEKEITLLNDRVDKRVFIPSIIELEKNIRVLKNDRSVELIKKSFNATPIKSDGFKSAIFKLPSTKLKFKARPFFYNLLAIFLGGLVGIFYVLIKQAYTNQQS